MDYVSSLLDRYYEIYQFVLNSDQYHEFIHLKKQLVRPYADIFDSKDELMERLLKLHALIVKRVWDTFRHQLIDIDEWDSELDKIDVFHLLRGNDPVIVIPSTPRKTIGLKWCREKRLGLDRHQFFVVAIDPQVNRKDAWKQLQASLGSLLGDKATPRNPKKRSIPKYEAFRLAREKQTFQKIGIKFGVDATTAHKAFCRDFEDIYGKSYTPGETSRRLVPIHQLTRTCATCEKITTCKKLCPEMEAFVSQDQSSQKEKIPKKPV